MVDRLAWFSLGLILGAIACALVNGQVVPLHELPESRGDQIAAETKSE